MVTVQLPGYVVQSVKARPAGKGQVYDIEVATLGATLVFGTFKEEVARKADVGVECVLCVAVFPGKWNRPELRLIDVLPCK